jgi:hypothetical protein
LITIVNYMSALLIKHDDDEKPDVFIHGTGLA